MAISNFNNVNNLSRSFERLASMKKLNKAKDNAAGLAIAQRLLSQQKGLDVGTDNALTGRDMYQVAEGGLSGISDSLQRIKELAVQASNATYSADDKKAVQQEIEGLKATITDAARGTEFNTLKLLDGSMSDKNIAMNPDGGGMKIQIESSTLETLGIADFDVTGNFDMSAIDNAISQVSSNRSTIGSAMNRLGHGVNYNNYASQNLLTSRSRIEDLDAGKGISDLKKNQVLQQYNMYALSAKNQQMKHGFGLLMNVR